jgi:hypothetical protein
MSAFKKAGVVVTTPSSGTYVIEAIGNVGLLSDLLREYLDGLPDGTGAERGADPNVRTTTSSKRRTGASSAPRIAKRSKLATIPRRSKLATKRGPATKNPAKLEPASEGDYDDDDDAEAAGSREETEDDAMAEAAAAFASLNEVTRREGEEEEEDDDDDDADDDKDQDEDEAARRAAAGKRDLRGELARRKKALAASSGERIVPSGGASGGSMPPPGKSKGVSAGAKRSKKGGGKEPREPAPAPVAAVNWRAEVGAKLAAARAAADSDVDAHVDAPDRNARPSGVGLNRSGLANREGGECEPSFPSGSARTRVTLVSLATDLASFRKEVTAQMTATCASVERLVYELRLRRAARGSIGDGDDINASIDPASIGADTPERVDRSLLSTLRAERASERAAYERDLAEVTRLATAARREDASRRPERTTRRRRSPPAAAVRDVAAPRVHRPPVPPSYPPPAPPPPHPPPLHHDTAVAMNWRDTVDAAKAAAFTARAVAAVAEPPADVAGAAVNGTPLGTLSD